MSAASKLQRRFQAGVRAVHSLRPVSLRSETQKRFIAIAIVADVGSLAY